MTKEENRIKTSVYRKPSNTGIFLHYQSHVDNRYKTALIKTLLYRAKRLSSSPQAFKEESHQCALGFIASVVTVTLTLFPCLIMLMSYLPHN